MDLCVNPGPVPVAGDLTVHSWPQVLRLCNGSTPLILPVSYRVTRRIEQEQHSKHLQRAQAHMPASLPAHTWGFDAGP